MLEETAKLILKTKEWRGCLIPSLIKTRTQNEFNAHKSLRNLGPIGRLLLDRGELTELTLPTFEVLECSGQYRDNLRAFTLDGHTIKLVRVQEYFAMEIKFFIKEVPYLVTRPLISNWTYWPIEPRLHINNFIDTVHMSMYMYPIKMGLNVFDNETLRHEYYAEGTAIAAPYFFRPSAAAAAASNSYDYYGEKDFQVSTIKFMNEVLLQYKDAVLKGFPNLCTNPTRESVMTMFALESQKKVIKKNLHALSY